MARIAEGIPDLIWGAMPDSSDDIVAPSDARQARGYDNSYFQPGGALPEGEFYNWLERRASAFKRDVARHGVLEWSADQNFEHPAACLASNNHLYLSTGDSGPDMPGGAVDPTGATGTTRWRLGGAAHDFVPAPQVTGTADAIELAPDPAFTVYQEGQTLVFRAEGDSTSGVTINVSGLGAVALHFAEGPAGAGLIRQGDFYQIRYDGTVWVVMAETPYAILPVSRGGTGVSTVADLLAALNIGNRLIPDGGTDGQVLTKASGTNFDADWEDAASAGLQTLTEGDHVSITGSGDSREIAVETGTTQGALAVLGTGGRFSAMRVPQLDDLEGTLTANQVPDLPDLNGTLDIASGGTGSTTAADARTALGLGTAAVRDTGTVQNRLALLGSGGRFAAARIPDLDDLNGTLDVASGGTGAGDAAGARANLSAAAAVHNHDGRYYTETEADARFLQVPVNTRITLNRATGAQIYTAFDAIISSGAHQMAGIGVWYTGAYTVGTEHGRVRAEHIAHFSNLGRTASGIDIRFSVGDSPSDWEWLISSLSDTGTFVISTTFRGSTMDHTIQRDTVIGSFEITIFQIPSLLPV